ncbi:probable methylcrotonoyl-CoA carboxylase biotin carboxylase chain [Phialocephala subalpina]|uniref:Probable methylcrotonoyl-CoA carboxylase biotin carboxylase chain n=1 Tax=Phialocephala subalpina TaxID=576137 RepID=A0A1L7XFM8_9HELO|nr:probable methylcrotonoyl-CoA carboxylase biotin carboxylase chain [Phialocephala subalpina]
MYPVSRSRLLSRAIQSSAQRRHLSTTTQTHHITSVLIANRGEIALRVGRTASALGVRCTTIYTDPDAHSQHALSSPFAINIGESNAYLDGERIISIAKAQGCEALHPGYGFLSENSAFAKRCLEEGLVFIGPPWKAIEAMGNKSRSKDIMIQAGVPCIPGYHGANQEPLHLLEEAKKIGFPVMVKAVKGGGGKGMRIALHEQEFLDKLESAKSEGRNSFGDDVMLVEKYIATPRHIEVQIFADKHGNAVALGERDCSLQRRHQKILEEAPAPNLAEDIRQDLWQKARAAALAVGYEGAGTLIPEVIFDNDTNEFFFMEMNTRLQVEHPVTEEMTGEDLVSWQFKVAAGEPLPLDQETIARRIAERGWAIEARIYAENPSQNFMPDSGKLIHLRTPKLSESVRIDAGFIEGDTVSSAYDGMIAKLIISGPTREVAIRKLHAALQDYEVVGLSTNIEFLKKICKSPDFIRGDVETGYIQKHNGELFAPDVVEPEAFAQAALGLLSNELSSGALNIGQGPHAEAVGFGQTSSRQYKFIPTGSSEPIQVDLEQSGPNLFQVSVKGSGIDQTYSNVLCTPGHPTISTFFPHTRVESTLIVDGDKLSLFQHGKQINLTLSIPGWFEKALGLMDVTNSVLAPMPCKVLRNEVKEGDKVKKDQPLVVIESMKMETVIRSPQSGVVAKLVHKAGDICKAGTVLVLFEEVGTNGSD